MELEVIEQKGRAAIRASTVDALVIKAEAVPEIPERVDERG